MPVGDPRAIAIAGGLVTTFLGGAHMGDRTCSVDGCSSPVTPESARGMCRRHYRSFMKYGDPLAGVRKPPVERFWANVDRSDPGGCWPWTGLTDAEGYGWFTDHQVTKSPIRTHRYAWMLHAGVMPPREVHVLHRCDNPPCVNPAHLFLGSNADNVADKMAKGRHRGNTTGNLGNLRRRLTDDQVAAIRAADCSRFGDVARLARAYGISHEHARRIRNGTRR